VYIRTPGKRGPGRITGAGEFLRAKRWGFKNSFEKGVGGGKS